MLNQKSINLIHLFEGLRLQCYHMSDNVCTIGWGHTRPLSQCAGAGSWVITAQQANDMFNSDIKGYEDAVRNYFTRPLNENQIGALTSFAYNLGVGVFKNYNWNKNASDSWISQEMLLYINKGSEFEKGLLARRKQEVALFNDKDVTNQTIENEVKMGIVQLTSGGDYYGKKYPKNSCFVTTGDSIRYIERPDTLTVLSKMGVKTVTLSAGEFLLFIQDMNLKIS